MTACCGPGEGDADDSPRFCQDTQDGVWFTTHEVPVSRSFHTVYLQTTAGHGTHRTGRRGEGGHGLAYTLGRHSSAPRLSTTRAPCRRYKGKQHLEITDMSPSPVTKACTTLDIDGLQDTWLNLQINSQRHEAPKDKARHVCLNSRR